MANNSNKINSRISSPAIRVVITMLAIVALALHLSKTIELSWEAIVVGIIALLPWMPALIESLEIGKDSFSVKMREIEQKADEAKEIAHTAKTAALQGVGKKPEPMKLEVEKNRAKEAKKVDPDDPQKGAWGGECTKNARRLSAEIKKIPGDNYNRRILIQVESTDPDNHPLVGKVRFHLHPTFYQSVFDEKVAGGVAKTEVVAYGAFTIGAEADQGNTQLELDLTRLDDGDPFFDR